MRIPVEKFTAGIHKHQHAVLRAFDRQIARFIMLVWHRRARKTTLGLNLQIREAIRYPKHVYTYVAPTIKEAKQVIWQDPNMLFTYLPDQKLVPWEKNESELYIRFPNASMLRVTGADDPDRLRGIDTHGVFFDEWAMMKEQVWTEIFRPIIAQDSTRWAMFCFTPKGQNHAFMLYESAMRSMEKAGEWWVSMLKASQSGIISPAELAKMRRDTPTAMYDQEMECAFITSEERTLITSLMLEELRTYGHGAPTPGKRLVSCDPSAGGDECPIFVFEDTTVIHQKILHERDPMKIAGEIQAIGNQYDAQAYVIDTVGLGWGLAGYLRSLDLNVIDFSSPSQAEDPDRFANKKAEAWFQVSRMIQDHDATYPHDPELRRQLSGVKYHLVGRDRMIMDKKEYTRKELGCSPDRADTYVQGLWALQYVPDERMGKTDLDRMESRVRRQRRSGGGGWQAA